MDTANRANGGRSALHLLKAQGTGAPAKTLVGLLSILVLDMDLPRRCGIAVVAATRIGIQMDHELAAAHWFAVVEAKRYGALG